MYTGHFAFGLAIKSTKPEIPILPVLLAGAFMDILCGFLILLGVEHITPNMNSGPYLFVDLDFIDWSHSLLMSAIFSFLGFLLFWHDKPTGIVIGLMVFSHFILDFPVHNLDMALFPYSNILLGMQLWDRLCILSWLLEGVLTFALMSYSLFMDSKRGNVLFVPSMLLAILYILLSPRFSPNLLLQKFPEELIPIIFGTSLILAYIVPISIIVLLFKKSEKKVFSL